MGNCIDIENSKIVFYHSHKAIVIGVFHMNTNQKISKGKFKAHALELFRKVQETGEPLIITDYGKSVLKLIPYDEKKESVTLESLRDTIIKYEDPLDPVGVEDWEAIK
jgi:antitoxin (DNA-binding transcriptional repressor) of toxin-antitoxin stability system